jgi:hypothetical protein
VRQNAATWGVKYLRVDRPLNEVTGITAKQRLCQHAFTAIVLAMPLRLDLVPSQIVQTQQVQGLGNNASFRLPEK